jgi:hypothetical protein
MKKGVSFCLAAHPVEVCFGRPRDLPSPSRTRGQTEPLAEARCSWAGFASPGLASCAVRENTAPTGILRGQPSVQLGALRNATPGTADHALPLQGPPVRVPAAKTWGHPAQSDTPPPCARGALQRPWTASSASRAIPDSRLPRGAPRRLLRHGSHPGVNQRGSRDRDLPCPVCRVCAKRGHGDCEN